MSDAALDIMSLDLNMRLLKCQLLGRHIGEIANINPPKVYNFRDLVFEYCHFSSAKAFLQRRAQHSCLTWSLVL